MATRLIPDSYEKLDEYRVAMDTATAGIPEANLPFLLPDWQIWIACRAVFIQEMEERKLADAEQKTASDASLAAYQVCRMYTSDYFQALNKAIKRGEFPASVRELYDIDATDDTVPNLDSEAALILWSERVATGEAARVAAGGLPLAFPSAAQVAAKLVIFKAAQQAHGQAKIKAGKEMADIAAPFIAARNAIMRLYNTLIFNNPTASQGFLNNLQREYGMQFRNVEGETTVLTFTVAAGSNYTVNDVLLTATGTVIGRLNTAVPPGSVFMCKNLLAGCGVDGKPLEFENDLTMTVADLPGPDSTLVITNTSATDVEVTVKIVG